MWAGLYPGQGSQAVGMGRFLFDEFQVARLVFEEASEALDQNLRKLCFDGPESELALTQNTQPALLVVSVAAHRVLQDVAGFAPALAAGHSVGEFAAVVCAGGLTLAEAAKAVRLRGQWMQESVPVGKGGMLAVLGWEDSWVQKLCQWASSDAGLGPVEVANFNAPGQVVISGSQATLEWMQSHYAQDKVPGAPARLKAIALKVSAPFHCSLMKPAEAKMGNLLRATKFMDLKYPVIQNVSALPESKADQVRENLIHQVSSSVRWVECVRKLVEMGAKSCVELGNGKVLAGLVKKIDSSQLTTFNITSLQELRDLEKVLHSKGS